MRLRSAVHREFLPGHDQKLRIDLENRAGGLLGLKALVEDAESYCAGSRTLGAFSETLRR